MRIIDLDNSSDSDEDGRSNFLEPDRQNYSSASGSSRPFYSLGGTANRSNIDTNSQHRAKKQRTSLGYSVAGPSGEFPKASRPRHSLPNVLHRAAERPSSQNADLLHRQKQSTVQKKPIATKAHAEAVSSSDDDQWIPSPRKRTSNGNVPVSSRSDGEGRNSSSMRPSALANGPNSATQTSIVPRKPKHCRNCSSTECPGRGGTKYCRELREQQATEGVVRHKVTRPSTVRRPSGQYSSEEQGIISPRYIKQAIGDKVMPPSQPLPEGLVYAWQIVCPPVQPGILDSATYDEIATEIEYLRAPRGRSEFKEKQHKTSMIRLGLGKVASSKRPVAMVPSAKQQRRLEKQANHRIEVSVDAEVAYDELSDLECPEREEKSIDSSSSYATSDDNDSDAYEDRMNGASLVSKQAQARTMRMQRKEHKDRIRYLAYQCRNIERDEPLRWPKEAIKVALVNRVPYLEEAAFDTFGGYAAGMRAASIGQKLRDSKKRVNGQGTLANDNSGSDTAELSAKNRQRKGVAQLAQDPARPDQLLGANPDDLPVKARNYPKSTGVHALAERHHLGHLVAAELPFAVRASGPDRR